MKSKEISKKLLLVEIGVEVVFDYFRFFPVIFVRDNIDTDVGVGGLMVLVTYDEVSV